MSSLGPGGLNKGWQRDEGYTWEKVEDKCPACGEQMYERMPHSYARVLKCLKESEHKEQSDG